MISEFPLFIFTLLGGMGAGACLLVPFLPKREDVKPWVFPLIVIVLLAVSALALMTHLGRLDRVLLAFSNPSSGITLEGVSSILFGVLVAIELLFALVKKQRNRVIEVLAGVAGLLLLIAMGYAYESFIGTRAWGTWLSYPLFVLGGAALGAPLAAFFVKDGYRNSLMFKLALVCLGLGFVSLLGFAVHFANLGLNPASFIVGAVLLLGAGGIVVYGRQKSASWILPCAFVAVLVGMAIARYAFYAVV